MRLATRLARSVPAAPILAGMVMVFAIVGTAGCNSSNKPSTQTAEATVEAKVAAKPSVTPPAPASPAARASTPAKPAPSAKAANPAPPAAPPAWQVTTQKGAKASLAVTPAGVMKVDIGQLGDGQGWQVHLTGPGGAVKAKERYTVSFRARAAEPRTMVVKAVQGKEPWDSLGLFREVSLTEQWQSFRCDFEAKLDDEKSRLGFNLGSTDADVEIAEVDLGPQTWFLGVGKDAKASLETPVGLPAAARVTIAKAADADAAWAVRINGPAFPVAEGEELYASFRARADAPRRIIAAVNMVTPPGSSLGLRRPVELSTEWKSFGFAFKPTASESRAQLAFHLGESDAAVEVQAASVRPVTWKIAAMKDHEAVLTFPDRVANGMRIDFGTLPEPEPQRVRLVSQPIQLQADATYRVSFRIRAEKPRDVVFTIRESQEPWTNLGLYGRMPVTEKWQTITREFAAKADASNAVWAFDVGGSDAPLELADVSFGLANSKPAASIPASR
jgi:hypothetical protein